MVSKLGADPNSGAAADSFSVGGVFGFDENVDPEVLTGTSHQEMDQPAQWARVMKVNDNGTVTVQMPDGKTQDLNSWQGKPITEKITHSDGSVQTIINRQLGFPNVQKQTDEKGHTFTTIMLGPGTTKTKTDTKKLSIYTKELTQMAQDADPKKRSDFLSLQDRLYQGGYYGDHKPVRGVPDAYFSKALNNALLDSVKTGQPLDDILNQAVAGNVDNLKGEEKKKVARDIRTTNATDIIAQIKKSANDELGRSVDDKTVQHIIDAYHKLETDQQNALYDVQDAQNASDTGGVQATTDEAPNLTNYVDAQVVQSNPGLAQATDYAGSYNALTDAIEKSAASVR